MPLNQETQALLEKTARLNVEGKFLETIGLLTDELLAAEKSPELYMELVQALYNVNKKDTALDYIEKAIGLDPAYAMAYYNRGTILFYQGEYEKALSDYNRAIALDPGLSLAYLNRGIIFFYQNLPEQAVDDYNEVIKLNPASALAYFNRGNIWYNKNETDKAFDDFSKAIELDPKSAAAYYGRGNTWYNRNEFNKAFEDYSKAIELDPSAALAYYGRGNTWYNKNEFNKAIEDYNNAIALNPGFVLAYNNRGLCYLNIKQPEMALNDFNKALALNPDLALAYNNIGLIKLNNLDYENALVEFDKAIEKDPTMGLPYFNRGTVWLQNGNTDRAIADFTTAIERMPTYAQVYYKRGAAYEEKEKNSLFIKSVEDYQTAFKLDPNYNFLASKIDELILKNGQDPNPPSNDKNLAGIFFEIIEKMPEGEKKSIRDIAADFFSAINKIKAHTHIKKPCPVVHYTKLWVADKIIMDKAPSFLHYSNVAFMNDPEEGKVLKEVLVGKTPGTELDLYFRNSSLFTSMDPIDSNVYLGSFLPASLAIEGEVQKETHEDELVMWRTYGKDENNNEAAGCSMIISNDFFFWPPPDSPYPVLQPNPVESLKSIDPLTGKTVSKDPAEEVAVVTGTGISTQNAAALPVQSIPGILPLPDKNKPEEVHILYRVLYYNKLSGKIEMRSDFENNIENENNILTADIANLQNVLSTLVMKRKDSNQKDGIDRIISLGLSELRYFFKSANYAFENEYRVIKYYDSQSETVLIEDRKDLPRPLYIKSAKPVKPFINRIYMGPKVLHPERWLYLEVALKRNGGNKNAVVIASSCKFQ